MTNPTTLQELADSLAVSATEAFNRVQRRNAAGQNYAAEYENGYRQALLDARATVLGMIDAGRVAVKGVHEYPAPTTVFEYAWRADNALIVHLVDPSPIAATHTLCGISTAGFVAGDETTSGLACNCNGCKDEFHVSREARR